jgi:hypothetical protein
LVSEKSRCGLFFAPSNTRLAALITRVCDHGHSDKSEVVLAAMPSSRSPSR